MVKIKNIMLITVIGIVVLFSGCTGNQDKNIAETAQSTPVQKTIVQTTAVQSNGAQTPAVPYQVQVTEVKNIQDCIISGGTTPCLLVNLNVKNNDAKTLRVQIVKDELVAISGRTLGTRFDKNVGLSNLCVRLAGMDFIVEANADKNVGLCYPIVNKNDNPTLNVGAMMNDQRKDFGFDLIKYGLTD
jgi:hypothetical protein